MTALTKEEIISKCDASMIVSRDCEAIARVVNVNRTTASDTEIGNGSIIMALNDLTVANKLLDELHTNTIFKYVVPLLDQGRLIVSSPLVVQTLQAFVPSILTQEQCNALIALGQQPDPVSAQDVAAVLYNPDGSDK